MAMMTSAYANKLIKKLQEDKNFWRTKESEGCTYVAAVDEEPVIPEYDYEAVAAEISMIDSKVAVIKHAINVNNVTNRIPVGDAEMTVDEVLVRMAQLNQRKTVLDYLRKIEPKKRMNTSIYSARKPAAEYQYINYDLDLVKKEYEEIDALIAQMQISLDKYNQTFEFEVPV